MQRGFFIGSPALDECDYVALSRAERRKWSSLAAGETNYDSSYRPFLSVMNTSLCGNFSKTDAG